jgi:hypothetical protein
MHRHTLTFVALFLVSCSDSVSGPPFYGAPLPRSVTTLSGVDLTLSADRVVVAPGDSVHFTVTATNRSSVRVQLGEQCGPSMDVAVMAPTRREQSALTGDRVGAFFTCALPENAFADPGVSRMVHVGWRAPSLTGAYLGRGALRRTDGLSNESLPLTITVR